MASICITPLFCSYISSTTTATNLSTTRLASASIAAASTANSSAVSMCPSAIRARSSSTVGAASAALAEVDVEFGILTAAGAPGGGVRYLHNDIELRPESEDERQRCLANGWDVDDPEALRRWRAQEPINAHSHLASMLLGSSECVPVSDGKLVLGQWQSVMLVDTDGPRERTVGVQLTGFK